ncbi:hypothetical protein DDZ18_12090 [Marinicauda salina]|uniref:TraB/GumN family protein n=1 Tax=Marinicauda salina TaxID=2135793 RepID=A0A2U2BR77_9PROT|nr:hypothetical protein DDZ18_12090 [Marinicauda salina]
MNAALAALALLAPAAAAQETDSFAEVMVLGTFHFTGGGSDYVNAEVDDFLSPTRQAQIEETVERIAAWAPTKIMIELSPEHEADFNASYQAYLDGEHEMTVNERQQLGMRLAARLGHDRLYAIDYRSSMDFDAMMGAAQNAGQDRLIADFQAATAEIEAFIAETEDLEVPERLIAMNRPEMGELHDLYMTLAQMGTTEAPEGAHQMADWWGRNMVIFARAAQHAEEGDRVLIIFGSGHKFLLEQYFDQAREFEIVDPIPYLEE